LSATPANTKSSAFQVLAYGRYAGNGWFAEGFAGSSAQHITADRTVVIGGTTSNLQGRTSGSSPTVGVSAGMPFVESDFVITPAAGLQWEDASIDGYTETGGVAAMTYHSFSRTSFTGRLGFDAVGNYTLSNVTIRPLVRAYLVHDFISNTGAVTAAFAQAPGALMTFGLANKSTNWVELGVGAQAKVSDNASVSIRYDATAGRSDLFSGAWTGDLNVRF
jgi:outer membrane autotransporter protein